MNVLLLSYDRVAAQSRGVEEALLNTVRSQPSWARMTNETYLITTPLNAAQLRDQLNTIANVQMLVYEVTNSLWAANGLPADVAQWLQSNWRQ